MSFEISDWHALFIHFPISLLSMGFLFDLLGTYYKRESLLHGGWWCMVACILSFIPAVISGLYDDLKVGGDGHLHLPVSLIDFFSTHALIEILVILIVIPLFYIRILNHSQLPKKYPHKLLYFFVIGLSILLMFFGSYLGGEFRH